MPDTSRTRTLSTRESRDLEAVARALTPDWAEEAFCAFVAVFFGAVLAGQIGWFLSWYLDRSEDESAWIVPFFAAMGVLLAAVLSLRTLASERSRAAEVVEPYDRDVREGRAEVLVCTVQDAVRIDSTDKAYFLDIGGPGLFFIEGLRLDEQDPFPTETLEIHRAPASGLLLGIQWSGPAVQLSRILTGDHALALQPLLPEQNGSIVQASLPTLEDDLLQKAAR